MPSSFVKITKGLIFPFILCLLLASPACSGGILIPMDLNQSDHLKAYGVVYRCLEQGALQPSMFLGKHIVLKKYYGFYPFPVIQ